MTRFRAPAILLLCLALLAVRGVGQGIHLHLCFDGSEPAAALHISDAEPHHQELGNGPLHDDIDLSLVDDALGKIVKAHLDLPVLLAVCALLLLLPRTRAVIPRPAAILRFVAEPRFTRPPSRAPPR